MKCKTLKSIYAWGHFPAAPRTKIPQTHDKFGLAPLEVIQLTVFIAPSLSFSDTMKASGSVGNLSLMSRFVGFLSFSSFSKFCLLLHAPPASLGDLRLTARMHALATGSNFLLLPGDISCMSFPSASKCAAHSHEIRLTALASSSALSALSFPPTSRPDRKCRLLTACD